MYRSVGRWFFLALLLAGAGASAWWVIATNRPEARYQAGLEALQRNDADQVRRIASQLRSADAEPLASLLLAQLSLQSGEPGRAIEFVSKYPPDDAHYHEAIAVTGRGLLELENLVEAERTFAYLLSRDEKNLDARRGLAAVYFNMGAFDRAEQEARSWADLSPKDGRPYRFIGLMTKNLDNYDAAIRAYLDALDRELVPRVRENVVNELAETYLKKAQFSEALETLRRGEPKEDSNYAMWRTLRGETYRMLGKFEDAAKDADAVVKDFPEFARALRLRGQLHLEAREYDSAVASLKKAVSFGPAEFETHHALSQAYRGNGDDKLAAAEQKRVEEIQDRLRALVKLSRQVMATPRDFQVHAQMAENFQALGMEGEARRSRMLAEQFRAVGPGVLK